MARSNEEPFTPGAGRIRRTTKAVRSGLRRYPPELVASILRRQQATTSPIRDVLTELSPEGLAVCWLGHASVVVGAGKLTVAVDPVLSERIGPRVARRTLGLRRTTPTPLDSDSIRGVEYILITHAHFDHLDRPTLERLADARTTVVVPPRCARLIPPGFARVLELAPGMTMSMGEASLRAIRPRHWGARSIFDRRRGSCAYELTHPEGNVLFAGDTAHTHAFDRMAGLDLAVFGIGAYEPWEHMHATPEQVWAMYKRMEARYILPVHHSTFRLSDEPMDEPMERLLRASGADEGRVIREAPGEIVILPPAAGGSPQAGAS